jgi:hypothetical protein
MTGFCWTCGGLAVTTRDGRDYCDHCTPTDPTEAHLKAYIAQRLRANMNGDRA